jgi:hypothetical protein
MASVSHEPVVDRHDLLPWAAFFRTPEIWASLAIMMMWLAVLLDAVYGPDFVSTSGAGTQSTTIPSAIFVAFFAFLATASIARHALRGGTK